MVLKCDLCAGTLCSILTCVQARFVVMGNVFPTDVRLHRKYDLKGSTLGRTSARKAFDPNTVLKVLKPSFATKYNNIIFFMISNTFFNSNSNSKSSTL